MRYVSGDEPTTQGAQPPWITKKEKNLPRRRDRRFFHLFLACCKRTEAAPLLLDLLDRQLLDVTPLVLTGFEAQPASAACGDGSHPLAALELSGWEALVQHMSRSGLPQFLPWIWRQIAAVELQDRMEGLLRVVLEQTLEQRAPHLVVTVLSAAINWREEKAAGVAAGGSSASAESGPGHLLGHVKGAAVLVRTMLETVSPRLGETKGLVSVAQARALWVDYFARCWAQQKVPVHAPLNQMLPQALVQSRATDLAEALPQLVAMASRDRAHRSPTASRAWWLQEGKASLTTSEVKQLGVDLPARVLLVQVCPKHALDTWAREILEMYPAFAVELCDEDFDYCKCRAPLLATKRDDKTWPLIRHVIDALLAAAAYGRALSLAIALLKQTCEEKDLAALKRAFLGVTSAHRRKTRLLVELASLWPNFGGQLQVCVFGICLLVYTLVVPTTMGSF